MYLKGKGRRGFYLFKFLSFQIFIFSSFCLFKLLSFQAFVFSRDRRGRRDRRDRRGRRGRRDRRDRRDTRELFLPLFTPKGYKILVL